MKTTVEIADTLLRQARAVAREEDTTVRALIEEGLRRVLSERKRDVKPFRLRRVTVKGRGVRPGLEHASWGTLRDLAYDDPGAS